MATWVSDCRIWEIVENKQTEQFDKIEKAFQLKGHKQQVYWVAFNSDSTLLATTSKDNTFKIWSIDFRRIGNSIEEAKCLFTTAANTDCEFHFISFSPDSQSVLITDRTKPKFYIYSALNGELVHTIEDNPTMCGPSKAISWCSDSSMFLTFDDNGVKVYRNPAFKSKK